MPRFHKISGQRVQFTAEEETARATEEAAFQSEQQAEAAQERLSEQKRSSGLNKLRGIGLDNDEISALWGSGILDT